MSKTAKVYLSADPFVLTMTDYERVEEIGGGLIEVVGADSSLVVAGGHFVAVVVNDDADVLARA